MKVSLAAFRTSALREVLLGCGMILYLSYLVQWTGDDVNNSLNGL
jgi:hypothetical protein